MCKPLSLVFLLFLSFWLSLEASAQAGSFELTESFLISEARKSNPQSDQIESLLLSLQARKAEYEESFAGKISFDGAHKRTREKSIISFAPVFSPTTSASLSYEQKLRHGLSFEAGITHYQQTADSIGLENGTSEYLYATVELDLWKDLFGRSSLSYQRSLDWSEKHAVLQKKVNQRVFENSLRRVYWDLVANTESLKIHEELKDSSIKQLNDAKKRRRQSVADEGEVARYEAQVASRKASITLLEFQRQKIIEQLRVYLPSLQSKNIQVSQYNVDQTIGEVLSCSQFIGSQKSIPVEHSFYDDMAEALLNENNDKSKSTVRHDDVDLKLYATVTTKGVDNVNPGTIGGAWGDLRNNDRKGYELGFKLEIPFGKSDTEQYQLATDDKKTSYQVNDLQTKMRSNYLSIITSVKLLLEVNQLSEASSKNLKIRVDDMLKKYSQARISVTELVNEQDAYLNAQLTVVDVRLQLLNALFDYLSIFTETPCGFNQVVLDKKVIAQGGRS